MRIDVRWVRTLALAALVPIGCGGGGGGYKNPVAPAPTNTTGSLVVEVHDNEFVPKSLKVSPGDTVVWRLTGSVSGHNVTAQGGAFSSGFVFTASGAEYSHTFTAADDGKTFNYYCTTHQGCCMMQGSIRVGDAAPDPQPGY